jgi:hypothetical protein
MSSTIENTNNNILIKINELKSIIDIYQQYQLGEADNIISSRLNEELYDIQSTYDFESISILSEYYKNKNDSTNRKISYNKYMKFITIENIIGKLKRVYLQCCKFQKTYEVDDMKLIEAFKKYEFAPITLDYIEKSNSICKCGKPYIIESNNSEFVCHMCGNTEKLYGIVFEDEQFFYQEGQRTKHGKYDPTKHCKFWVDRIQAKENADIAIKVTNEVKRCIKRDNIWLEQLTCPMIREYLKELKMTNFNDHVPLIRKIITGHEPDQLSEHELKLVYIYFGRVIQIYNKTKPDNKPNCPYHPFFIYKILEQILNLPNQQKKRKDILSSIHLQSRETLIENDNIWKPICDEITEFIYTPTDGS